MGLGRSSSAVRASATIALGALTVHQLRYLAGYGDGAGAALGSQGHAYLAATLPLLIVLAAAATLGTLALAASARRSGSPTARPGWLFCTAALLVIFGVQESFEGLLAAGHPRGLSAVFGHDGWVVLPIAALIGRLVAWLLDGLTSVERALAGAVARGRAPRGAPGVPLPTIYVPAVRRKPLAFGGARRPPPATAD
jgi:hypothetical protein